MVAILHSKLATMSNVSVRGGEPFYRQKMVFMAARPPTAMFGCKAVHTAHLPGLFPLILTNWTIFWETQLAKNGKLSDVLISI